MRPPKHAPVSLAGYRGKHQHQPRERRRNDLVTSGLLLVLIGILALALPVLLSPHAIKQPVLQLQPVQTIRENPVDSDAATRLATEGAILAGCVLIGLGVASRR